MALTKRPTSAETAETTAKASKIAMPAINGRSASLTSGPITPRPLPMKGCTARKAVTASAIETNSTRSRRTDESESVDAACIAGVRASLAVAWRWSDIAAVCAKELRAATHETPYIPLPQ